jgi:hypothetical protein
MSNVVAMLNSESVVLPEPNHPAYFNLRVSKEDESASAPYGKYIFAPTPQLKHLKHLIFKNVIPIH